MTTFRLKLSCLAAGLLLAGGACAEPAATIADPPAEIVAGRYSGLALHGRDPVAYQAGLEERGRDVHTALWAGAIWRFANEGNRAAFLGDPEIYAPVFGGHCAVALARGALTEGDPSLFVRHRGRVYFFYSAEARAAFLDAPDATAAQAFAHWRELMPQAPLALSPLGLPTR